MKPIYFLTKHWLKQLRWRMRRKQVALRWGASALENTPSALGNAMPKSGSHLIIQVLRGLTQLGPFVDPGFPPVNRFEDNSHLNERQIVKQLEKMRSGDIRYAYLPAREPYISALLQPNRANVFIYRDPRDMIVSHVFYATVMYKEHGMHRYYTETLSTIEERINAAILGVREPDAMLSSVAERYRANLPWLDMPDVFSIQFEDIILNPQNALGNLLEYLVGYGLQLQVSRSYAVDVLCNAIAPKKSGTFRKGRPGGWREHFTSANKRIFKENTGELLQQLGYETDNHW